MSTFRAAFYYYDYVFIDNIRRRQRDNLGHTRGQELSSGRGDVWGRAGHNPREKTAADHRARGRWWQGDRGKRGAVQAVYAAAGRRKAPRRSADRGRLNR